MSKNTVFPKLKRHTMMPVFNKIKKKKKRSVAREGIYIFGGIDDKGKPKNSLYLIETYSNPWRLSTLTTMGNPPEPRYDHCCYFIEARNFLLVYGGRTDNTLLVSFWDIFVLDLASLNWYSVALADTSEPSIPRYAFQSFYYGSRDS